MHFILSFLAARHRDGWQAKAFPLWKSPFCNKGPTLFDFDWLKKNYLLLYLKRTQNKIIRYLNCYKIFINALMKLFLYITLIDLIKESECFIWYDKL